MNTRAEVSGVRWGMWWGDDDHLKPLRDESGDPIEPLSQSMIGLGISAKE